ncbi:MAG TPA: glycosyltransferase family 39 protein [Ktedonobacterales bacterium]
MVMPREKVLAWWRTGERQIIAALALFSAILNVVRLPPLAQLNLYYATAVKSMTLSWHNWLFVAFDPGGFVSVDKPPLGLWLQALCVKLFGFTSFSLLLPQLLAGVLSAPILFILVRRVFGVATGLIAGLLLATSPINVVLNRSNLFESPLVLIFLLAALTTLSAIQRRQVRWLLLSAALIGIGFNIKSLEAWLIVPACLGAYLVCAALPKRWRAAHGVLFLLVLMLVSFSWIEVVDHVPTSQRPWVDSTLTNSELDLALNYNGLQRLLGQPRYADKSQEPHSGTGQPGALRLFEPPLGTQASWFLPLALVGLISVTRRGRPPRTRKGTSRALRQDPRQAQLLFWGVWLATMAIFFSVAEFFNPYYVAVMTPAVCALAGIGAVRLWHDFLASRPRGWLLLVTVLSSSVAHVILLSAYPNWNPWLIPTLACLASAVLFLLIDSRLARTRHGILHLDWPRDMWWRLAGALAIALVLSVAPVAWLMSSYGRGNSGWFPISGPVQAAQDYFGPPPADPRLIAYLTAHHARQRVFLATIDAHDAIPIILATEMPVMAMGGYSHYDPIITTRALAKMVANDGVRFFLLPVSNLTVSQVLALYPDDPASKDFHTRYTNALTQWVSASCQPVAPHEWAQSATVGSLQLFDCATHHS